MKVRTASHKLFSDTHTLTTACTPICIPKHNKQVKHCFLWKTCFKSTHAAFHQEHRGSTEKKGTKNNWQISPPKTYFSNQMVCLCPKRKLSNGTELLNYLRVRDRSFQMTWTVTGLDQDQMCQPQASRVPLCLSLLSNKHSFSHPGSPGLHKAALWKPAFLLAWEKCSDEPRPVEKEPERMHNNTGFPRRTHQQKLIQKQTPMSAVNLITY